MDRVALNKSVLQKEREKLQLYRRLLPSLDLKRRQLALELGRAKDDLAKSQRAVREFIDKTVQQLPMLAEQSINLSGFVRIESVRITEENLVGVRLPRLQELTCTVDGYSLLAEPHWVDLLVERLKKVAELQIQVQIYAERAKRIEYANRRITQRINLFEKILIPEALENIKRIQIFLGDAERAAVVRSKISKAMHEKQRKKALRVQQTK